MERWNDPVILQCIKDDEWVVQNSFGYIDPDLGLITVPSGTTTDLGSVGRLPVIYTLFGGYGVKACIVHDYLYTGVVSRRNADKVFKNALRSSGISRWRTWCMYYAVRVFGSRFYKG